MFVFLFVNCVCDLASALFFVHFFETGMNLCFSFFFFVLGCVLQPGTAPDQLEDTTGKKQPTTLYV